MGRTNIYNLPAHFLIDDSLKTMKKNNQAQPLVKEEEIVSLLEERLLVNRHKRKVGEVVVRKKVETRLVQVPVRREILIVEKVGEDVEQLAEIDLGEGQVNGVEVNHISNNDNYYHVSGEFISPQVASKVLDTIAREKNHGCIKVRIELAVENSEYQENYQTIFDQITRKNSVEG